MIKKIYFKYFFILFIFFANYSYAAKMDDFLKVGQTGKININTDSINKSLSEATKAAQNEITTKLEKEIKKLQENLNNNITNITNKFDEEIKKTTDRINNNVIEKAENLVNDATNQYNSLIKTKEKLLSYVENIINNLPTYILILKLVLAIIIIGIFSIVFLFWRSYRKVKNLALQFIKLADGDYLNDINNKLNSIDAKLDSLLKK